jgi:tRNA threonylcarbamoyladenosine biosynthesis protein TsaE
MPIERRSDSEQSMEALGATLAPHLATGLVVYLHGELGAGKTTLVRGILRGLGHRGSVKSPTYTLVEPYLLGGRPVYHFDLYRVHDPEELEFLGLRDYLAGDSLCLVEWAERGGGIMPTPDIDITIERAGDERRVQLTAHTEAGHAILRRIA